MLGALAQQLAAVGTQMLQQDPEFDHRVRAVQALGIASELLYRRGVPGMQAVTYTEVEDGWVQAQLAELPGVITVARSRAEAAEDLLDAMQEYLLSLQQPATTTEPGDRGSVEVAISLKSA